MYVKYSLWSCVFIISNSHNCTGWIMIFHHSVREIKVLKKKKEIKFLNV